MIPLKGSKRFRGSERKVIRLEESFLLQGQVNAAVCPFGDSPGRTSNLLEPLKEIIEEMLGRGMTFAQLAPGNLSSRYPLKRFTGINFKRFTSRSTDSTPPETSPDTV